MIVPRTRLILWVSLIVLPFAALAGTMPSTLGVCAFAIGALFTAAFADALLARSRVAGIRVELPDLVRLQKDRASQIEVRIHNDAQTARAVRIGLTFPDEISVEDETQTTALPGGSTLSRLDWHCTPRKRGQYFLERAYLEAASPLGFWSARASHPVRSELRVYPNLFDERKNVAALFLKRGDLGIHAQRQAGQGRDFEKLRSYIPGGGALRWQGP